MTIFFEKVICTRSHGLQGMCEVSSELADIKTKKCLAKKTAEEEEEERKLIASDNKRGPSPIGLDP